MLIKEVLIELTNTEQYPVNGDLFPTITHIRMVNFLLEVPRPNDEKIGYIDIWLAKGYLHDGIFHEAPGYVGLNFKIEEPEIFDLVSRTSEGGIVMHEIGKVIDQYLIDTGRIDGTLIINEYEL